MTTPNEVANGLPRMTTSTPPLLPPPPRSSHTSSRTSTPRPPEKDLLSSSPPRLAEPLFPTNNPGLGSTGNNYRPHDHASSSSYKDQEVDTSFGSFTDAPTPARMPFNTRAASTDPLNFKAGHEAEHDLLGSFGDEESHSVPETGSAAGMGGPGMHTGLGVVSLLSGNKLVPTPQHHIPPGNAYGASINNTQVPPSQDLLGEIDAFLSSERGPIQVTTYNSTSSSSRPSGQPNPQAHPRQPPRRLSQLSIGASSPPAISPISSLSFRGKNGLGMTRTSSNASDPQAGQNDGWEGLDDFGAWATASASTGPSGMMGDLTGIAPALAADVVGNPTASTPALPKPTGQDPPRLDLMERMRRLSFDRPSGSSSSSHKTRIGVTSAGPGLNTQAQAQNQNQNQSQTVNLGRKPSWLSGRSGMVGSFPVKKGGSNGSGSGSGSVEQEKPFATGNTGYTEFGGLTDEPGAYEDKPGASSNHDVQAQAQAGPGPASMLAEGTKRMTGLVHALGTLASKTASAKPKSKWRTVMGPGTFSPPPQGRGDPYFSNTNAGASGSDHAQTGTWGRSSSGYMDEFNSHEPDRPTPTAQPIEITHHNPFNLGSTANNQHTVFIPGTNMTIHPTGSYMPAPPTGAPGFRGEQNTGWEVDRSQRRDDWGGTKLIGRREGTVPVLDDHAADALRPNLPARQRLSNTWTLLFSLDQHGGSLSTFYRLIEAYSKKHPHAGNMLIIKDENDRRFGVYMNEWIKRVEGTYTGSGESWLYKIVGDDLDARAKVFKWTGRNTYFALCESDFISFGGGDGKYGLWVDKVFQNGSSATSPAYANEVLCAQEGSGLEKAQFDCMALEVWATSG